MDRNKAAKAIELVAWLGIGITLIAMMYASASDPWGDLYYTLGIVQMGFWILVGVAGCLYTCPSMYERHKSQSESDIDLPQTQMSSS